MDNRVPYPLNGESRSFAALDSRNRLPSPIYPQCTIGASQMMMDHGKSGADFQRVDAGIGDIAGTPDTARDRRLTPVYRPSPDRRKGLARGSVVIGLRRFHRP